MTISKEELDLAWGQLQNEMTAIWRSRRGGKGGVAGGGWPVVHGQPELGLVPWLRMWRMRKGNGFWCSLGNGWRFVLTQGTEVQENWVLWKGSNNEKVLPYLGLYPSRVPGVWLEGCEGLSKVVAQRAPPGLGWEICLYHAMPGG